MFGFLNINKPKGITSFDVIRKIKKILKIKQLGHAGTLDPLAEGVLPIALGKASRLIEYLPKNKAYIAKIQFGYESSTYDADGEISKFDTFDVSLNDLKLTLPHFIGDIEQIPPMYSAVHYNGRRLYELAREGTVIDDLKPRKITISKIDLQQFDQKKQTAEIYVECSGGTYIRTLIVDIAKKLETRAYMSDLTRVISNNFHLSSSISLKDLELMKNPSEYLVNPLSVLEFPMYNICDDELQRVLCGNTIRPKSIMPKSLVSLVHQNRLVSIANVDENMIYPKKVLL